MEQKFRCKAISEVRGWCLANGFDDRGRATTFDKDIPFGIMKIEVRDGFPDNRHESIRFEFGAVTCDGQWAFVNGEPMDSGYVNMVLKGQ